MICLKECLSWETCVVCYCMVYSNVYLIFSNSFLPDTLLFHSLLKVGHEGWGYSLMDEHLHDTCGALVSAPCATRRGRGHWRSFYYSSVTFPFDSVKCCFIYSEALMFCNLFLINDHFAIYIYIVIYLLKLFIFEIIMWLHHFPLPVPPTIPFYIFLLQIHGLFFH